MKSLTIVLVVVSALCAQDKVTFIHNPYTLKASVLSQPLKPTIPPGFATILLKVESPMLEPGDAVDLKLDGETMYQLTVLASGPETMVMLLVSEKEARKIRRAKRIEVHFIK